MTAEQLKEIIDGAVAHSKREAERLCAPPELIGYYARLAAEVAVENVLNLQLREERAARKKLEGG